MLSRKETVSDNDFSEGIVAKEVKGRKKSFFEVDTVSLLCTPEVRNMVISNFSLNAYHVIICEQ